MPICAGCNSRMGKRAGGVIGSRANGGPTKGAVCPVGNPEGIFGKMKGAAQPLGRAAFSAIPEVPSRASSTAITWSSDTSRAASITSR